ncbi:MAG: hypothetical protein IJ022_07545 [Burkholderiaceae bacterium]|nr:hypothetical protein [Burkholderiaceae bacterium]
MLKLNPVRVDQMSNFLHENEMQWHVELPRYKIFSWPHFLLLTFLFILICLIYSLVDYAFFFKSWWAMFILPATGLFLYALINSFLPNIQMFYRIDRDGIYGETRYSSSKLLQLLKFLWRLMLSFMGSDDDSYKSSHTSKSRHVGWKDVRKISPNEQWNRISLQCGLQGSMIIWLTDANFNQALNAIRVQMRNYSLRTRRPFQRK